MCLISYTNKAVLIDDEYIIFSLGAILCIVFGGIFGYVCDKKLRARVLNINSSPPTLESTSV